MFKAKALPNIKINSLTVPLLGVATLSLTVGLLISLLGTWAWVLPFAVVGAVAGFICFVVKPEWGVAILLLEMIWGGNGRWLELLGETITFRYLLIIACVLGYVFGLIFVRRRLSLPRFILPLAIFYYVVFFGVTIGVVNRNPSFLQDAQVWLYLFLAVIIVDLWNQQGPPYNLLRLVLLSTAGIAAIQLALTVLLNIRLDMVIPLYPYLNKIRILPTPLPGTPIWYVFMGNSALYGYAVAICILLATGKRTEKQVLNNSVLWFIASLALLAAVLSMTRGTWGQVLITLVFAGFDLLVRKRLRLKTIFATSILLLIPVVMTFSIPEWRDAGIARVETLLPWNADSLDANDSVIVKQVEAQRMATAIGQSPLFGYGFGLVQVDNDLSGIYFHNSYLQFALKTGLIGLVALLFLFLYTVVKAWVVGRRVKHRFPQNRDILYGLIYGFLGMGVAASSNPHMTTPIFVTMLAFTLAFAELVHRQWRRSQQVNRGRRH